MGNGRGIKGGNVLLSPSVFSITMASVSFPFSVPGNEPGPGRGRKKPLEHPSTRAESSMGT
jgi:hypothetical protein